MTRIKVPSLLELYALTQALGANIAFARSKIHENGRTSYVTCFGNELLPACAVMSTFTNDMIALVSTRRPFVECGNCPLTIKPEANTFLLKLPNHGQIMIELRFPANVDISAKKSFASVAAAMS